MSTAYDVFLSHNSRDKPSVEVLALRLRDAGLTPFLDRWHLIPGEPWQEALEEALDQSATVAVFIGPSGISPWHNEEMRDALNSRARDRSYRVIPVLLPGATMPEQGELPRFLTRLTWVDFRGGLDDQDAFHRLLSGVRGLAPGPDGEGLEPLSEEPPYKGLRYFDVEDADLFFGRDTLTATLVDRLRRERFLAVVGASGSGKSSVVRAGLVPALKKGEPLPGEVLPPEGSDRWEVRIITPTAHPLKELAACLTGDVESVTATATLMDDLAKDPRSLDLAVTRALQRLGGERLLLVVDQFEELFTACKDQDERKAFIDNLLTASSEEAAGPTVVVITLRADFYHHCAQYDNLRLALEKHQAYIGAMKAEELHQAVEEPARQEGWDFEPGLVDLILQDVGDGPGGLPLLSHALLETWRRRRGRQMTLEGYQVSGGVRAAIARTADRVFMDLSEGERAIARGIFLRLTELGEGTEDTRRRAGLEELVPRPEQHSEVEAVLKTLADARLVTTDQDSAEVSHEALIREWPRLREWLEEDRESLRLHRHLTQAAEAWERMGRDLGELYRGARLAQALDWEREHGDEMSASERVFLGTSQDALGKEVRARRLRWVTIAGALGVALVVGTLALTGQLNRFIYRPGAVVSEDYWVMIPEGKFMMGSPDGDRLADSNEFPQHEVDLDTYQIGAYEVTNRQYNQCVLAGICVQPGNRYLPIPDLIDHPVTDVSWFDAQTFCEWAGGRLPTEAEWEKAARGGLEEARYPWGNDDATCELETENGANFLDCDVGTTLPVGSFAPNGYGLYDMAGNVWEWVADWYDPDYYGVSPSENPQGPETGNIRVLRGGSWSLDGVNVRSAFRAWGDPVLRNFFGFRCARSP